jgi:ABC-type uncharacterized transport system YnjBCD substrate-binding protein
VPKGIEPIGDDIYGMVVNRVEGMVLAGAKDNKTFERQRKRVYKFLKKHGCTIRMVDTYLGGGQTKVLVNEDTRRIIPHQGELPTIIEFYYKESGGSGASKLAAIIAKSFHGISKQLIQNWLNGHGYQMAKTPAFTNKDVLKPVRAKRVLEIQQIDLTKMPDLEKGELNFQYVMSVLDVFSR